MTKVKDPDSTRDPYRYLFPFGLAFGAYGVLLWALFAFGASIAYPGQRHASLMIGGFFFAFAAGFLMTAVPRFTGTKTASRLETAGILALLFLLFATSFLQGLAPFHAVSGLGMLALMVFGFRRLRRRTKPLPPSFAFVGLGLLAGLVGTALELALDLGYPLGSATLLARSLYFQGMTLSLVLGVGSRLVPALFGWMPMPLSEASSGAPAAEHGLWWVMGSLALLFSGSFLVEAYINPFAGRALRASIATGICMWWWRIYRLPRMKSRMNFGLWVSAWSIVVGTWAYATIKNYEVDALHIVFIGGLGLMVLMIATRVVLAHGGHGLALERESKTLIALTVIVLAAVATRVAAPLVPKAYFHHLGYAAVLWLVALLLWSRAFIGKLAHRA